MSAANGAEGRERRARLAGNEIGDAGVDALVVALQQTARPKTLRFGGSCVLVPLRCFGMIVAVLGASKTVLCRLMRGSAAAHQWAAA